jgi:hypothetical protein
VLTSTMNDVSGDQATSVLGEVEGTTENLQLRGEDVVTAWRR